MFFIAANVTLAVKQVTYKNCSFQCICTEHTAYDTGSTYCVTCFHTELCHIGLPIVKYVGLLESKERLRIQPAQLFNFS